MSRCGASCKVILLSFLALLAFPAGGIAKNGNIGGDTQLQVEVPLPVPRPLGVKPTEQVPLPEVPLPPLRREELPETPGTPIIGNLDDPACVRLATSKNVITRRLPAIVAENGCGIAEPVQLEALVTATGLRIEFEGAPVLRCDMAEAVGNWLLADVVPGTGVTRILSAGGYECRSRNRVDGAKLSEHAQGNAFDLRSLVLADKSRITIGPQSEAFDFLASLKSSACARFTTVLGPGSDTYHEDHLHVDLAVRRHGTKICEWTLRRNAL